MKFIKSITVLLFVFHFFISFNAISQDENSVTDNPLTNLNDTNNEQQNNQATTEQDTRNTEFESTNDNQAEQMSNNIEADLKEQEEAENQNIANSINEEIQIENTDQKNVQNEHQDPYSSVPTYVEVETQDDYALPYSKRRGQWGTLFSVGYEAFNPINYYSPTMGNYFSEFSNDNSIPMVGAEFGVKYNLPMGSAAILLGYKKASLQNEDLGITDFTIDNMSLALNFTADNVFDEPYIAPYLQAGVSKFSYSADLVSGTVEANEGESSVVNFHIKAGILFQLNWIEKHIDENSQFYAMKSSGLQNTFIDVFYSTYSEPSNSADENNYEDEDTTANFRSSHIGAALKMEF